VCVKESQVEMGHYDSGELAYAPSWQVILVGLADRKPCSQVQIYAIVFHIS